MLISGHLSPLDKKCITGRITIRNVFTLVFLVNRKLQYYSRLANFHRLLSEFRRTMSARKLQKKTQLLQKVVYYLKPIVNRKKEIKKSLLPAS
ncbi:hypothetical protein AB205_0029330 [Aquarana catesbeiana]|uniref:Uncharacterized protein n=1 Tax=Aquarana catesbeiana TaxID=8400 RepID=A0A2G9RLN1_AQUCT|nr:hypothetical protein AB205_0029330 [Aquarana catesbeiana]